MTVKNERPTPATGRTLSRSELQAVIRRAAELYAAEADERTDDRVTEEEILEIAEDLGLPAVHVRQALFELPETQARASGLDGLIGEATVAASRIVAGDAEFTLERLEDYLATREYMQPHRRMPGRALYAPADDAISRLARVFSRPAARFELARAHRVGLAVQPLEEGYARVRIELDLSNRRREAAVNASIFGGVTGLIVGGTLLPLAGPAAGEVLGTFGVLAGGALTLGGGVAAGLAGSLSIVRATFRRRLARARDEIEGLLDRLQHGDRLEPPPAPWRRRLQSGVRRHLSPGR